MSRNLTLIGALALPLHAACSQNATGHDNGSAARDGNTSDGGGAGDSGATYSVDDAGYVKTCDFSGYAWTVAGPEEANGDGTLSSISPSDFSDLGQGETLCASGTVSWQDDYGGYAMVGINLGQEPGDDTPSLEVSPIGDGLFVDAANDYTNELRVQIQDEQGSDDANHRWCAILPPGGVGVIRWEEFNTACWDGSGVDYDREPISIVAITVPGSNTTDIDFSFCLNSFRAYGDECGEVDAPSTESGEDDTTTVDPSPGHCDGVPWCNGTDQGGCLSQGACNWSASSSCIPGERTCIPGPQVCTTGPQTCVGSPPVCVPGTTTCLPGPETCVSAPETCVPGRCSSIGPCSIFGASRCTSISGCEWHVE